MRTAGAVGGLIFHPTASHPVCMRRTNSQPIDACMRARVPQSCSMSWCGHGCTHAHVVCMCVYVCVDGAMRTRRLPGPSTRRSLSPPLWSFCVPLAPCLCVSPTYIHVAVFSKHYLVDQTAAFARFTQSVCFTALTGSIWVVDSLV